MAGLVILLLLTAFSLASFVFGVDSRDDSTDPRRPAYPVGIR
jgi:hypothetical protein